MTNAPILSPEQLHAIAQDALGASTADTMSVALTHMADGVTRVMNNNVRLNASGDTLSLEIQLQFGKRLGMRLETNQIDRAGVHRAVRYLERVARDLPGDDTPIGMTFPPPHYGPSTTWHDSTAAAFTDARHHIVPALVEPVRDAGLTAAAYVGVHLRSVVYLDRAGLTYAGKESDSEIVATGWSPDERSYGWAGQTARDWSQLDPAAVSAEARRLSQLAVNPVAFEPGRYTVILARPAVAQFVAAMGGGQFDARTAWDHGPLYDPDKQTPRLGQRIWDARLTLSSDPNDPVAGYLSFNEQGNPLIPMTWVTDGVLSHLAYLASTLPGWGVSPTNDAPRAMRMSGGITSLDEMIANCELGIYVNRFARVQDAFSTTVGELEGVTDGGCFLVRHGKIEKSIKNLTFRESPWLAFNRIEAIGPAERAPFGYSPWLGSWPLPPVVVPPMMIRDFNFTAMSDAV